MSHIGCCNLEIKQLSDTAFSVKIDGMEISQYLTELSLLLKAGEVPTLSVRLLTDTVNLGTTAKFNIPPPYDWMIQSALTDGREKSETP